MNDDENKQMCLKMFLISRNMVFPKEFNCFSDLSESSYKPHINGDIRYPKMFENKYTFSTDALPMPDLCVEMEIDNLLDADRSESSESKYSCSSNTSSSGSDDLKIPELKPSVEKVSEKVHTQPKLKVKCLQSIEDLKETCKNQGLKFNDYSEYEASKSDSEDNSEADDVAYEVDMIYSDKEIEGEKHYLVKWKNYRTESNTWEPSHNLAGCQESIDFYCALKNSKLNRHVLEYFIRDLTTRKPNDILSLTKVCALCSDVSENYVYSLKLTTSQLKAKVKELLTCGRSKLGRIKNKLLEIMQFAEARKQVLINLKEWECEINSKNESAYIEVENNVDLETAPTDFQFIHDYINTIVRIPEEPLTFCQCDDCYANRKSCCPHDSEGMFAYSRYRRLLLEPGYPIYECNKRCKCGSDCINRVVQHGQKVKVSIFRTSNGCGWGLKTLETIEKGQFVLEYLGEIITSEAAEARGNIYDYVRRSYLFDLDYGVDNCCYTVDAGHVGNAAHFINHSCDPNLHVFAVWINQPDPNLPRLAFFAKRRIRRGEELTFDYKMVQKDRFGPQSPTSDSDRVICRCNSKNCRKYLF